VSPVNNISEAYFTTGKSFHKTPLNGELKLISKKWQCIFLDYLVLPPTKTVVCTMYKSAPVLNSAPRRRRKARHW
jgi:hypothetical protein